MKDETVVFSSEDLLSTLNEIDFDIYDEVFVQIDPETEFYYVTETVDGKMLFIESILTRDGDIKHHETDILIIHEDLPKEILDIVLKCEYKELHVLM